MLAPFIVISELLGLSWATNIR